MKFFHKVLNAFMDGGNYFSHQLVTRMYNVKIHFHFCSYHT